MLYALLFLVLLLVAVLCFCDFRNKLLLLLIKKKKDEWLMVGKVVRTSDNRKQEAVIDLKELY